MGPHHLQDDLYGHNYFDCFLFWRMYLLHYFWFGEYVGRYRQQVYIHHKERLKKQYFAARYINRTQGYHCGLFYANNCDGDWLWWSDSSVENWDDYRMFLELCRPVLRHLCADHFQVYPRWFRNNICVQHETKVHGSRWNCTAVMAGSPDPLPRQQTISDIPGDADIRTLSVFLVVRPPATHQIARLHGLPAGGDSSSHRRLLRLRWLFALPPLDAPSPRPP